MKNLFFVGVAIVMASLISGPVSAQMVTDLPEGTVKVSGVVPAMGEHWIHPKDRKRGGPVFGIMDGKIVFIEYELLNKRFAGDKNVDWNDYKMPAFMPPIDHTDFTYLPKGHRNMEVPHVAIHMYTVSHAEHMKFRPPKRRE